MKEIPKLKEKEKRKREKRKLSFHWKSYEELEKKITQKALHRPVKRAINLF